MAVYEHTYRPYAGEVTPTWSRFLIIPRHALQSVFQSKFFIAFFIACLIYPLIAAIVIYLPHNESAKTIMKMTIGDLIPIDADFFYTFVAVQGFFGFFLNLLVGPPLISRDLSNNALPLYLCRPFTRAEYVLGKMSVVVLLLSVITWIPGLLLFLFQSYLGGTEWFRQNLYMAGAIFLGSVVWILILALLSQAISALVKWRLAASAALLAIFFIPSIFGEIINNIFFTRWGHLLSLRAMIRAVWAGLFGIFERQTGHIEGMVNGRYLNIVLIEPPVWTAWLVLSLLAAVCMLVIARRVRAYEVVRG
ncbi:MAG TPA: ABC transporter permease [Pyrinomonadaceae bacterium]|jgi:ABC-2 type transport system permease protein|nr:ABC transporter permease [Pyrinomonadaceae bacterium]